MTAPGTDELTPAPTRRHAHGRRHLTPWWVWLLVIGAYVALGQYAYLHIWTGGITHSIVYCGCSDQAQEVWFLRWVPFAVGHSLNPLFSTWINYPAGANLMVNTSMPVLGLVAAPLTWLFGPVVSYNLLLSLMFPASALGAFVLFRRWTHKNGLSFLGGLIYGFSPFILAQGYGHLFLGFAPIAPLAILVLDEIVIRQRGRSIRWGVLLGVLLALQLGISAEIVAMIGVFGAGGIIVLAVTNFRAVRSHLAFALKGFVATGVTVVVLAGYPLWMMLFGPQHTTGAVQRPFSLGYQADLLGSVLPTVNQWLRFGSWTDKANTFSLGRGENGTYLGVTMILLLVGLAIRYRRDGRVLFFAFLSFVAWILSLGHDLRVNGHTYFAIHLPYLILVHLPLLASVFAHRIAFCTALFTTVLFVVGLNRAIDDGVFRRSAVTRWLFISLVGVALVPLVPDFPYPWIAQTNVPAYFSNPAHPSIPAGSVVLTYPFPDPPGNSSMLWQAEADFHFKMVGGYVYVPAPGTNAPQIESQGLTATTFTRLYAGLVVTRTASLRRQLRTEWREEGVQRILFAPRGANPDDALAFLRWAIGTPPTTASGGVIIWNV